MQIQHWVIFASDEYDEYAALKIVMVKCWKGIVVIISVIFELNVQVQHYYRQHIASTGVLHQAAPV